MLLLTVFPCSLALLRSSALYLSLCLTHSLYVCGWRKLALLLLLGFGVVSAHNVLYYKFCHLVSSKLANAYVRSTARNNISWAEFRVSSRSSSSSSLTPPALTHVHSLSLTLPFFHSLLGVIENEAAAAAAAAANAAASFYLDSRDGALVSIRRKVFLWRFEFALFFCGNCNLKNKCRFFSCVVFKCNLYEANNNNNNYNKSSNNNLLGLV